MAKKNNAGEDKKASSSTPRELKINKFKTRGRNKAHRRNMLRKAAKLRKQTKVCVVGNKEDVAAPIQGEKFNNLKVPDVVNEGEEEMLGEVVHSGNGQELASKKGEESNPIIVVELASVGKDKEVVGCVPIMDVLQDNNAIDGEVKTIGHEQYRNEEVLSGDSDMTSGLVWKEKGAVIGDEVLTRENDEVLNEVIGKDTEVVANYSMKLILQAINVMNDHVEKAGDVAIDTPCYKMGIADSSISDIMITDNEECTVYDTIPGTHEDIFEPYPVNAEILDAVVDHSHISALFDNKTNEEESTGDDRLGTSKDVTWNEDSVVSYSSSMNNEVIVGATGINTSVYKENSSYSSVTKPGLIKKSNVKHVPRYRVERNVDVDDEYVVDYSRDTVYTPSWNEYSNSYNSKGESVRFAGNVVDNITK